MSFHVFFLHIELDGIKEKNFTETGTNNDISKANVALGCHLMTGTVSAGEVNSAYLEHSSR